ncbi:HNH endonuclease domain-containing protein [Acidovorax sp. RAC01]|uniref:HNH endonuclease domain-containing protein n=1 Tax=Acidovorax sp. RAC01 TaxID=1842533 RepID=UPI0018D45EED|nr:HNH endonuclease domain-containing protein [Acidovorax sp. RAC01]
MFVFFMAQSSQSVEPPQNPGRFILYGRNTASYKFALAEALLKLRPESGQLVRLEELAPYFASSVAEHLAAAPKQITTRNGRFIQACLAFNEDQEQDRLVRATVAHGFANVIDAFHVVGSAAVHHRFYTDERRATGGIRITDEFSKLLAGTQTCNLGPEVDARWRLVETAWNLGISANLLAVHHDANLNELFAVDGAQRRRTVTSSRAALNGYQKGRCFYCHRELQLLGERTNADIDHFFPHRLKQGHPGINLDGVWNLVLACPTCNRGADGKFDRIPTLGLLERLHQRNEHMIGSHHPLRETLMMQTGMQAADRASFLNQFYRSVQLSPALAWAPKLNLRHST